MCSSSWKTESSANFENWAIAGIFGITNPFTPFRYFSICSTARTPYLHTFRWHMVFHGLYGNIIQSSNFKSFLLMKLMCRTLFSSVRNYMWRFQCIENHVHDSTDHLILKYISTIHNLSSPTLLKTVQYSTLWAY